MAQALALEHPPVGHVVERRHAHRTRPRGDPPRVVANVHPLVTLACVVIATAKRRPVLDDLVMPSVVAQGFDEVVVVGDYRSGDGWRHLPFRPLTGTTIDALFKRDVGTAATSSDWLFYLCDDHRIHPDFSRDLLQFMQECAVGPQDVIVPARFCQRNGEKIGLNMGWPGYLGHAYCGGHGGIYPRAAIQQVPWSLAPWHPNWDFYYSQILLERGYNFHYMNGTCYIEDVDPNGEPWL
jgi:hypothetical protein